jgi:DNA-binding PadR family transcriptional regulator
VPSTLGYALLGLLARQPRTGYELTQLLRAPIGYYWTASHSQVYPELAALEADKLIGHRVIDGPGPRDTKRYRITAAGRRALATWAARRPDTTVNRDELMLKVYSLWTADPIWAREMVVAQREADTATLLHYQRMERSMQQEHGRSLADPTTPEFSSYATLRRGLSFQAHAIAWCDWLLDALTSDLADQ